MPLDTLRDLWERNARLHGDGLALAQGDRRLSHAELLARGTRLANGLASLGVRPADRVSMLAMNCLEYGEVLVGNHVLGSMANTLNFRLAPSELQWILADSVPRVLIFELDYAETVEAIRSALPSIEHFIAISRGDPVPDWAMGYEDLLASANEVMSEARPEAEDIAHLIYTSGTTGRPKGVLRSHRCEVYQGEGMACGMDVMPNSRLLEVMPLFHIGAQASAYGTWWRGGAVFVERVFDPEVMLQLIQEEGLTHLHLVPMMVQQLLDVPDLSRFDLSTLETLLYAAAPITPAVLRRGIELLGPVFVGMWGMTEGSGTMLPKASHRHKGTEEEVALLASVGQEQQRTRIRIVDEEGADCALGTSGEIWLQSRVQMSGYWNNPVATIDAFRDGWFRTGDMGYFDKHSNIFLVDRKKDMIISGGENIYSQEVERALAEHEGVDHVAVIGVPSERWGEAVMAVVVARPGVDPSAEDLIAHCGGLIAAYKRPKSIEFIDALPVLASGKVDKVALRAKFCA
jgi:acyl-CoA synthetase (AMP-forming)/AMP-acid ligase II